MEKNSNFTRGVILTLMGGTFWGLSGSCSQYLFDNYSLDCTWLTSVRLLTAGIILTLWLILTKRADAFTIWKNKKDAIALVAFGIIGLISCQYSYLAAISYTNAATGTVLEYTGLVLVMFYTCVKLKRLPSAKEAASVLLAIIGVFLIATHGNINNMVISTKGLFWGVASAVGLLLYTVIPERIIRKYQSPVVTAFGMLTGGIVMFFLMRAWDIPFNLDFKGYLALAGVVLIGTVLSFTLYLQGVGDIGAVRASVIACIEPVSATVISALWLKTSFAPYDLVGFALIIITVLILAIKDK